eukprot:scpid69947/ scgid5901/ Citrate lyase subunit beta-like protein, mitochondrial
MATVVARGIQGGLRPAWRRSAQVQMQYGGSALRAASSSTVSKGPQNGPRHSDLAPWYRSCLFVPGDSERKLRKSVECGADLCILDLDDGVGHDKKAVAREMICNIVPQLVYPSTTNTLVRLNATSALTRDGLSQLELDVGMLSTMKTLPSAVGLSKADTAQDVETFITLLDKHLPQDIPPLGIYLMVESPLAIVTLEDICSALVNASQSMRLKSFLPGGLAFGHMDYCTDMGIDTTVYDRSKFLFAEQKLATVARAYRLQAMDCAYTLVKDLDGLRTDCQHAKQSGFTGKTLIHPSHVSVANEVFSPPAKQVAWARGLLDAYARHNADGQAVFVHEGELVDEPIFRRARLMLEAADRHSSV